MTATEYKAGTNLEKILSEGKFAVTSVGPGADITVTGRRQISRATSRSTSPTTRPPWSGCSMASAHRPAERPRGDHADDLPRPNRLAMQADILPVPPGLRTSSASPATT
jgi:hypothetical protein